MREIVNESIQSPLFWLTIVLVPLVIAVAVAAVYVVRVIDRSTGATLAIAKKLWGKSLAKREQNKRELLNYLDSDPNGIPTLLLASNSAILIGVALLCIAVALFYCTGFIVLSHAVIPTLKIPPFGGVIVLVGGFMADIVAFMGLANIGRGLNLKRVLKTHPSFFRGLVKMWF
jgi:hypothetical protein